MPAPKAWLVLRLGNRKEWFLLIMQASKEGVILMPVSIGTYKPEVRSLRVDLRPFVSRPALTSFLGRARTIRISHPTASTPVPIPIRHLHNSPSLYK